MRALLLKDFYTLKKRSLFMLVLIAVFALMPGEGNTQSFLPVVFAAALPITAMAYDERARWERTAAALPYGRATIVLSRYALGLICVAAAVALILIGAAARHAFGAYALDMSEVLGAGAAGLCFGALVMPFMHWLGVEKGRLAYFAGVAIMTGGLFAFKAMPGIGAAVNLQAGWLPLGALALDGVSALVSIWLYKRRAL